jgi:hypothetical protein
VSSAGDRLRERLELEEPVLLEAFPTARIDPASSTVTLYDYRLPAGWSHEVTDVLFGFPTNYPAGCPDNVCVRPDLRLVNGELPQNNQGTQTHAGRAWLQLSWHVDAEGWTPTADPRRGSNLVTYLVGALARFEEAS